MEIKAGHPLPRTPPTSDRAENVRASPPRTAAQRTAKYRAKNRDKINADQAKFRDENPDLIRSWKQAHAAKEREKKNEQNFRWRERMHASTETLDGFFFSNRYYQSRPTFQYVDAQGGRGLEEWETPDEMVTRMRMQKILPPIPTQAKELSPKRPKKEGPT